MSRVPVDFAAIGAELNKVLDPSVVSSRVGPNNREPHYYLSIGTARALANDIFGAGNWDVLEKSCDVEHDEPTKDGMHTVRASCCARVSLKSGAFREDIGFGEASGAFRSDVERQARAIARSDATKRCLRAFGNALGNCLFYKEYAEFATQ